MKTTKHAKDAKENRRFESPRTGFSRPGLSKESPLSRPSRVSRPCVPQSLNSRRLEIRVVFHRTASFQSPLILRSDLRLASLQHQTPKPKQHLSTHKSCLKTRGRRANEAQVFSKNRMPRKGSSLVPPAAATGGEFSNRIFLLHRHD
jgi:hypothetical protein